MQFKALMTICAIIILSGAVYYGLGWTKTVFGEASSWIASVAVVAAYVGLLRNRAKAPDLAADDPSKSFVTVPDFPFDGDVITQHSRDVVQLLHEGELVTQILRTEVRAFNNPAFEVETVSSGADPDFLGGRETETAFLSIADLHVLPRGFGHGGGERAVRAGPRHGLWPPPYRRPARRRKTSPA